MPQRVQFSAKNVPLCIVNFRAAHADEVRLERRKLALDRLCEIGGVQPRVLRGDHGVGKDAAVLLGEGHFADQRRNVDLRKLLVLGALFDHQRFAREQRAQRVRCAGGHAVIIEQLQPCAQERELAHGARDRIALPHAQARGQTRVELFGDARAVGLLHRFKVEQLAVARLPHRQRQDDGDDGVRVKAVGVLEVQLRTGKHALECPHRVEVRDVGGLRLLGEKKSQLSHRRASPIRDSRRSRCSVCGSPAW
mgnify:CR=1 FL=1